MKTKTEDYFIDNNLYPIFEQQINYEIYQVCVQQIERIDGTNYWIFGKLYELAEDKFYFEPQGCKVFENSDAAINEACNFFGQHDCFIDNH